MVQLQGAHGPLTASQSKTTLDRLRRHGAATDIFDHHVAREEAIVNNPLITGNKVLLLQNGPATYTAMLAAIHGAHDHINMETLVLEDDAIGELFAHARQRGHPAHHGVVFPQVVCGRRPDDGIQPGQSHAGARGLGA